MKKVLIMMTIAATFMGCCAKKPHYESVDDDNLLHIRSVIS